MSFFDWFTRPRVDTDTVTEAIQDLSRALENQGWQLLGEREDDFSREALNVAARDGRTLAVAHPLVRRGLALRASYIHGAGVEVTVDSNTDANQVVQAWWDEPGNKRAVTGPEARARLERSLSTDGNVFIVAFSNQIDGRVLCRTLPFTEITNIITNPDDRLEPWFYERETTSKTGERVTVLHPDIRYAPTHKPGTIDGHKVLWDQPVRHVKINDLDGWLYGIGDVYSVSYWARAYRDFLRDWATHMRSLAQFSWRSTVSKKVKEVAAAVRNRLPGDAGSTAVMGDGVTLEAIPKSGATLDADSGRPLLAMVAAGLDVPITMLASDPGVTGTRATAETLDEPMYRAMQARRDVWTGVYTDLAQYVVEQAVAAKSGPLKGELVADRWTRTDRAVLAGEDGPVNVTVTWPDLSTTPLRDMVEAIVKADQTEKLPPEVVARQLLTALGEKDADTVIKTMMTDDGVWIGPARTFGDALMESYRTGADPGLLVRRFKEEVDGATPR
ncbi:hypothetical protein ACUH93_00605 [Dermabacteraceae bacterium P7006]